MNAATVRYHVRHETCYEYAYPVGSGRQLAHLTPRRTHWQTLLEHRLDVDPAPVEFDQGEDFFGNPIHRFAVEGVHETLTVIADSQVEVRSHAPAANSESPPWELACEPICRLEPGQDLDPAQFRAASPSAPTLPEALDYALPSFAPGRPWLDALIDLTQRIRREFTYDPEATTVTTPVAEVLQQRAGVCQDFAHTMISCLRSLEIPARYVSGYILNTPPPGKARLIGADASHAWVAAHCPGLGWIGFDPTNGKIADTEFITLSWGRDFSDVTPLRGVVLGSGEQQLTVRVTVSPLPADDMA